MKSKKETTNKEEIIQEKQKTPVQTEQPQEKTYEEKKQEINEIYSTPPAGVYPKTDSKGRIIKYKKRGGVFAFFMGIFATLFLFVFVLGLGISYAYYGLRLKDIGATIEVPEFLDEYLGGNVSEKTANQIMEALKECHGDLKNMTVGYAKEKGYFDLQQAILNLTNDKLNIDVYEKKLSVPGINNGHETLIKDMKILEIVPNMADFLEALLPELKKEVSIQEILDLTQFDLSTLGNYPIFYATTPEGRAKLRLDPNPTFTLGDETYKIDFENSKVFKGTEEVATITDSKFTLSSVEYTISADRTKLTYNTTQTKQLTYDEKLIEELTLYELQNNVLKNYFGGNELTINFIQKALGKNFISDEDLANHPELATILNSKVTDLKLNDLIETVSVGTILDIFPSIELPNMPIFSNETFLNTKLANIISQDSLNTYKLSDFINFGDKVIDRYLNFNLNSTKYYITDSNISTKKSDITISDENTFNYNSKTYEIVDKEVFDTSTSTKVADITGGRFSIGSEMFLKKSVKVLEHYHFEYAIVDNQFTISTVTYTIDYGTKKIIGSDSSEIALQDKSSEADILVYSIKDASIGKIVTNDLTELFGSLDNITLGDLLGNNLTGILTHLKDISLFELIDSPNIILESIENVQLSELGFTADNPLFSGIEDLYIGDLIHYPNMIMDIIRGKDLATITGSSTGIMGILGNITIGELLDDPTAISTTLQSSTAKLYELLQQDFYEYDGFIINDTKYYIVSGNVYLSTDLVNSLGTTSDFVINDIHYEIVVGNVKTGGEIVTPVISASNSLTSAILTMEVKDLFGNNLETQLRAKIDTIKLGDVISPGTNDLLDALINKGTTIGSIGEDIQTLKISDVFSGAGTSGIISLLSYTDTSTVPETVYNGGDIPLMHLMDAFGNFDITEWTIMELYQHGVLDLDGTIFDVTSQDYQDYIAGDPTKENLIQTATMMDVITTFMDSLKI